MPGLSCTMWKPACPAGTCRCGTWCSRAHCPSARGVLPDRGSIPCLLHWQARFLTTGPPGKTPAHRLLLRCLLRLGLSRAAWLVHVSFCSPAPSSAFGLAVLSYHLCLAGFCQQPSFPSFFLISSSLSLCALQGSRNFR